MRIKQTYNLDESLVLQLRNAVESAQVASQDAAVEEALRDYLLAIRHRDDAARFAQFVDDPEAQAEWQQIDKVLAPLEPDWPDY